MSTTAVARRYAGALFDVCGKANSSEAVRADLASVVGVIAGHEELQRVLTSPAVSARQKRAVIDAILAKMPELRGEIVRLVQALADRNRLGVIEEVANAFDERLRAEHHMVTADVVTAVPLDAAGQRTLAAALGAAMGKTVQINAQVDPAIIGGVVARVGSMVFDGSIARQLQRLKVQLSTDA